MTAPESDRAIAPGLLQRALIALCGMLALSYAVHSVLSIWQFGFSEIFSDQFRQYRGLIERGFPASLVMSDNGHRMVLPNLVRVLDIEVGGGDQRLGVALGIVMLISAFALLAAPIVRFRDATAGARGAAVLLCALGLFWLGSARMQFHGNESFQVYLVMCCAFIAIHLSRCHAKSADPRLMVAAVLAAALGMLTFAPGVAIFPLLIALAIARRADTFTIVSLIVATVAVVGAYMFLLPGGEGVRNAIELSPVELLRTTAAWLASFWLSAWPGLGDSPVFGVPADAFETHPATQRWAVIAGALRGWFGDPSAMSLATGIGAAGLLLMGGGFWRAWRRPHNVREMEWVGLGIALFASAVAGLVAIGRLGYFRAHPDQIFADRYVLWTVLFWLGLGIVLLARLKRPAHATVAMLAALAMAVALLPTQFLGRSWGTYAERMVEMRAAQAQAGVLLPGFPSAADLPDDESVHRHIDFFRGAEQAMFRSPRSRLMGDVLSDELWARADGTTPRAQVSAERVVEQGSGETAWHVQGRLSDPSVRDEADGLVLVNSNWRVVGMGEFSHDPPAGSIGRVDRIGLGFDLFGRDALSGCQRYGLLGLNEEATAAVWIAELELCGPDGASAEPVREEGI